MKQLTEEKKKELHKLMTNMMIKEALLVAVYVFGLMCATFATAVLGTIYFPLSHVTVVISMVNAVFFILMLGNALRKSKEHNSEKIREILNK